MKTTKTMTREEFLKLPVTITDGEPERTRRFSAAYKEFDKFGFVLDYMGNEHFEVHKIILTD